MVQMMSPMPPREYVIERATNPDGSHAYLSYWRDPFGMAPFPQRICAASETATGLQELMERHYPGAKCVYVPEDCTAVVAEAMAATKGGSG